MLHIACTLITGKDVCIICGEIRLFCVYLCRFSAVRLHASVYGHQTICQKLHPPGNDGRQTYNVFSELCCQRRQTISISVEPQIKKVQIQLRFSVDDVTDSLTYLTERFFAIFPTNTIIYEYICFNHR